MSYSCCVYCNFHAPAWSNSALTCPEQEGSRITAVSIGGVSGDCFRKAAAVIIKSLFVGEDSLTPVEGEEQPVCAIACLCIRKSVCASSRACMCVCMRVTSCRMFVYLHVSYLTQVCISRQSIPVNLGLHETLHQAICTFLIAMLSVAA